MLVVEKTHPTKIIITGTKKEIEKIVSYVGDMSNKPDNETIPFSELEKDLRLFSSNKPLGAIHLGTQRWIKGWTQAELAEKMNVSQVYISRIESGKRAIGKSTAKKLGKIFGINDYTKFLKD